MSAFLHPFSDAALPEADFVDIRKAKGSTLWDANGKAYIDGLASLWYCQVGHGHPDLLAAITEQLNTLATYNTFAPFTNDVAVRAAEAVRDVSPHPDGRVFFGCSGSEAIDTMLKMARLIQQRRGHPHKQLIIRRTRGYHGVNFGGTSAQGIEANRAGWGDLVPHFIEAPSDDIEAMATLFAEHGDRIAGVLTEPLQGAGGVFPPPDGYLQSVRRLCDDHGALLMHDEVICGFGRTGEWFGSQTYGVTPDLISFAKGVTSGYMPVSGVIVSREVADLFEGMGEMFRHGYTYSGHPGGMAAVIENINIIKREGLIARSREIGEQFSAGLQALQDDGLIHGYDGVAGIWGAEVGRDALPVREHMRHNGVVARSVLTRIAVCPPLVITNDEIATMLDSIESAIVATKP